MAEFHLLPLVNTYSLIPNGYFRHFSEKIRPSIEAENIKNFLPDIPVVSKTNETI